MNRYPAAPAGACAVPSGQLSPFAQAGVRAPAVSPLPPGCCAATSGGSRLAVSRSDNDNLTVVTQAPFLSRKTGAVWNRRFRSRCPYPRGCTLRRLGCGGRAAPYGARAAARLTQSPGRKEASAPAEALLPRLELQRLIFPAIVALSQRRTERSQVIHWFHRSHPEVKMPNRGGGHVRRGNSLSPRRADSLRQPRPRLLLLSSQPPEVPKTRALSTDRLIGGRATIAVVALSPPREDLNTRPLHYPDGSGAGNLPPCGHFTSRGARKDAHRGRARPRGLSLSRRADFSARPRSPWALYLL